jgi:hypothetical protein
MSEDSERTPTGTASDGTVRGQYDWSVTEPSTAIVEMVAEARNRDPTELEPLYGAVNADALDAIVRSDGQSTAAGVVTVSFEFADQQVTVHSSGDVVVHTSGPER